MLHLLYHLLPLPVLTPPALVDNSGRYGILEVAAKPRKAVLLHDDTHAGLDKVKSNLGMHEGTMFGKLARPCMLASCCQVLLHKCDLVAQVQAEALYAGQP